MPQQPLPPHQYTIVLSPEVELTTLPEALERAGGKITHRLGRRAVIIRTDKTEAALAQLLPPGTRLLRSQDPVPDGLSASEAIQLRASRVRQSAKFREAKRNRPHEGQEWGKGDLPAPDGDDEPELTGGQIALADADASVVLPTNERLINDVAVGVVIVSGHGQYAISDDEKANIVAEIQEGVGWLGDQEPDANVSWSLDVKDVTVDITPWQGARWPGMPEGFFRGMDAALLRQDNGKIYFFRGDQYVRFSNVSEGVDEGYPRSIGGHWNGLPASFHSGIDAVLMRHDNDKIYFFKGKRYVRYSDPDNTTDANYPRYINKNWIPFPQENNVRLPNASIHLTFLLIKTDWYIGGTE